MNEEDLKRYRQLKAVLLKGKFELNGDAVNLVASLFTWYESLGAKIEKAIPKKIETKKPKSPIKKVGE